MDDLAIADAMISNSWPTKRPLRTVNQSSVSHFPQFYGTKKRRYSSASKRQTTTVPRRSADRVYRPLQDNRVRERDPVDYASTVDMNRPYFDPEDSERVKELAYPFREQLCMTKEYISSGAWHRTDKSVEYFMRQNKYFKLRLFEVFEKLPNWHVILEYINKVFHDSTAQIDTQLTTELLNNAKKRDKKRRAINIEVGQNKNSNKN